MSGSVFIDCPRRQNPDYDWFDQDILYIFPQSSHTTLPPEHWHWKMGKF